MRPPLKLSGANPGGWAPCKPQTGRRWSDDQEAAGGVTDNVVAGAGERICDHAALVLVPGIAEEWYPSVVIHVARQDGVAERDLRRAVGVKCPGSATPPPRSVAKFFVTVESWKVTNPPASRMAPPGPVDWLPLMVDVTEWNVPQAWTRPPRRSPCSPG